MCSFLRGCFDWKWCVTGRVRHGAGNNSVEGHAKKPFCLSTVSDICTAKPLFKYKRSEVGYKLFGHSDVVGASPVGAAQILAWRRQSGNPLSEPMMVRIPTHICVTRPQWVKWYPSFTPVISLKIIAFISFYSPVRIWCMNFKVVKRKAGFCLPGIG